MIEVPINSYVSQRFLHRSVHEETYRTLLAYRQIYKMSRNRLETFRDHYNSFEIIETYTHI